MLIQEITYSRDNINFSRLDSCFDLEVAKRIIKKHAEDNKQDTSNVVFEKKSVKNLLTKKNQVVRCAHIGNIYYRIWDYKAGDILT